MSLVELWHFSQQLLQSQVSLFGFPAEKKKKCRLKIPAADMQRSNLNQVCAGGFCGWSKGVVVILFRGCAVCQSCFGDVAIPVPEEHSTQGKRHQELRGSLTCWVLAGRWSSQCSSHEGSVAGQSHPFVFFLFS